MAKILENTREIVQCKQCGNDIAIGESAKFYKARKYKTWNAYCLSCVDKHASKYGYDTPKDKAKRMKASTPTTGKAKAKATAKRVPTSTKKDVSAHDGVKFTPYTVIDGVLIITVPKTHAKLPRKHIYR